MSMLFAGDTNFIGTPTFSNPLINLKIREWLLDYPFSKELIRENGIVSIFANDFLRLPIIENMKLSFKFRRQQFFLC